MKNQLKNPIFLIVASNHEIEKFHNEMSTRSFMEEVSHLKFMDIAPKLENRQKILEYICSEIYRLSPDAIFIGQTPIAEEIVATLNIEPQPLIIRRSEYYGSDEPIYTPRTPVEAGYNMDIPKDPSFLLSLVKDTAFVTAVIKRDTKLLIDALPKDVRVFRNLKNWSSQILLKEKKSLRQTGLLFFHKGVMKSFELGCHPHEHGYWKDVVLNFDKAYECFKAVSDFDLDNKSNRDSNKRLAALSLLEAASLDIEQYDLKQLSLALKCAARAKELFFEINDKLGMMASNVVMFINSRGGVGEFNLGFQIEPLLLRCSKAVNIPRVREAINDRVKDINKFHYLSHAFPERSLLSLTIFHSCVPFCDWKVLFDENQREQIPHFELEIASVLIAFVLGVATTVTGGFLTTLITERFKKRKETESAKKKVVDEFEIIKKLDYLFEGYLLREFYFAHKDCINLSTYLELWKSFKANEQVRSANFDLYEKYKLFRETYMNQYGGNTSNILNHLADAVRDCIPPNNTSRHPLKSKRTNKYKTRRTSGTSSSIEKGTGRKRRSKSAGGRG